MSARRARARTAAAAGAAAATGAAAAGAGAAAGAVTAGAVVGAAAGAAAAAATAGRWKQHRPTPGERKIADEDVRALRDGEGGRLPGAGCPRFLDALQQVRGDLRGV